MTFINVKIRPFKSVYLNQGNNRMLMKIMSWGLWNKKEKLLEYSSYI